MAKKNKAKIKKSYLEVGKFGLIGIINTLIDVFILNLLSIFFGVNPVLSNFASTSVAMTFSFFANKKFVFENNRKDYFKQAAVFLIVTAFGLYVIQTFLVFRTLTEVWLAPMNWVYEVVKFLRLDGIFSEQFVRINGAKAIGIAFSMVWNFIMYKKVVFKK